MTKKAVIVGSGFSGISCAAVLADYGYQVTVLEKHDQPGGRARIFEKEGFRFDMGPSWYWMPEIMEQFFNRFGKSASDYFELVRLDPSYQVIFGRDNTMEIPAGFSALQALFESKEKGAGLRLEKFLSEAQQKYEIGMGKFVRKPALSIMEFVNAEVIGSAFKLDLLKSFSSHVRKYFKSPELLQILEFPVLFLGAMPKDIPALYSMMNYADIKLGTWYPMGGFGELAKAMYSVAREAGVEFRFGENVTSIAISDGKASGVSTENAFFEADVVVSAADYHFTETKLVPEAYRNYSGSYWEKRVMAPSCLLYYVGVNKKVARLQHHNLFFESDFEKHAKAIYSDPQWPEKPLFYVCCPSKTDGSVAPEGKENLFILIPVAPGMKDTAEIRKAYFAETMERLEDYCGQELSEDIEVYTDYAYSDFVLDYNAFKGNAYGLANTLRQTAILKPSIRNRKVANLYYTGQLTVPGPGVPPAIISGQLVADHIHRYIKHYDTHEAVI